MSHYIIAMQYNLQAIFGNIDIYLFDQLLKGTYEDCHHILDAGCGSGRNLNYFLGKGCDVYGVDSDPLAIEQIKQNLNNPLLSYHPENFIIAQVDDLPFADEQFDLVISSAVLHFARNLEHFEAMISSMWRVLKKDGYLFCRLASDIGIESAIRFVGNGRYILPDESERFLVNQEMLLRMTRRLNGTLHEPIKTTNVQNMRSMTTWCLRK